MAYFTRGTEKQGYSQMRMNYINDVSRTILRMTTEMEFAWRVQSDFKDGADMEKFLEGSRKEIEQQIEYLKGYLQPLDRDEE